MILILTAIIFAFFIYFYIKKNREITFITSFLIFGYICYFSGYLLIFFMFKLKNGFRDIDDINVFFEPLLISIYFFILLIVSYELFKLIFNKYKKSKYYTHKNKICKKIFYKTFAVLMISISILSVSLYVYKNGGFVLLKMNDYTDRFSANAGLGFFRMFFSLYIPGLLLFFLLNPSKRKFYIYLILMLINGLFTYASIGGMRNLIFLGILSMLFLGINFRYISLKKFIISIPLGLLFLTFLAFIRYGNEVELNSDSLYLILNYTIDSVSPVYSLYSILHNVPSHHHFVGFEYFFNQFLSFIPRSIWSNKPLLMETNAYIFTVEILGYPRDLIISPTSIGVFYMMFGFVGVTFGAFFLSLLLYFLDSLKSNSNLISNAIFYYFLPLTFWVTRGTLEYLLYNLILYSIAMLIVYVLSVGVYAIFLKNFLTKKNVYLYNVKMIEK